MRHRPRHTEQRRATARQALAFEAARLMAEQSIDDPLAARRKALHARAWNAAPHTLPEPAEILACLRERLALLHAEQHTRVLQRLRSLAVETMRLLDPFSPRLVGAVLDGTAVDASPVVLHLLDSRVEDVVRHLLERGIRYRLVDCTVRYSERHATTCPGLQLDGANGSVQLIVFSPDDPRQAPLDPRTGERLARAGRSRVEALLERPPPGADEGALSVP